MRNNDVRIVDALQRFAVELPSWGFANTGTRFGKFLQPAAAVTIEEKFSDAGHVHALTGACPTLALHVLWDVPDGAGGAAEIDRLSALYGVRAGSINPNLFQDQQYKFGSFGNPEAGVRAAARQHVVDSIALARVLRCRDVSLWFADGSNYPGTANIRQRRAWFVENLRASHAALGPDQRLLVEYKPFEPAFYHTDIADWGMALLLARAAGPRARVLVDTGHHYQSQNIEQIVAWLLSEQMLGGFHFNDRRYADDDLTTGSIDPYQLFRIFHEIRLFEAEHGLAAAFPQDVVAGVDGDPVHPRGERRVAAELGELAEHRQERVLRGISGIVAIAEDPESDVEDARLMAFDEHGERSLVSGEVPADEVLVGFGSGHARQRYRAVGPLVSVALTLVNFFVKPKCPAMIVWASLRTVIVTVFVWVLTTHPFLASFAVASSAAMAASAA